MNPRVSVVIPAYNREAEIVGAIASVLRQSFADFELIVVDDGSEDGTADAAEAATADPRVRVLRAGLNSGVSAARNLGVEAARADWVAFQDSDDEWLPTKLEKQMARLDADPGAVAAYCGMIVLGEAVPGPGAASARARVGYVPRAELEGVDGDVFEALLRESFISTQTLVARRDALRAVGGFDAALAALVDWDCMLRLSPRGRVVLVDEPLVLQRFSPNSITRSARKRVEARERIVAKQASALRDRPRINAEHYVALAGGWRRLGETGRALRWAQAAVRVDPTARAAWRGLAAALLAAVRRQPLAAPR